MSNLSTASTYSHTVHELARILEPLAARAVPAEENLVHGPWRFRYSPGVSSRRANSILTVPPLTAPATEKKDFEALLAEAVTFYTKRHNPVRLQISPASVPMHLDPWLKTRGFIREMPGEVWIASLKSYKQQEGLHNRFRTEQTATPTEDWLKLCLALGSLRGTEPIAAGRLFSRIMPKSVYVTAYCGREPVGIGMGVGEAGWLGLFSLATHPAYRRQGVATTIIDTLAAYARTSGAHSMYLQVADENTVARRLYARLGFRPGYPYHYRVLPT